MRVLYPFGILAATQILAASESSDHGTGWHVGKFSNLVVFGDSYSDESRLTYYFAHNYTLPPAGTVSPQVSLDTIGTIIPAWG